MMNLIDSHHVCVYWCTVWDWVGANTAWQQKEQRKKRQSFLAWRTTTTKQEQQQIHIRFLFPSILFPFTLSPCKLPLTVIYLTTTKKDKKNHNN